MSFRHDDNSDDDVLFFEDKEVMQSQQVGDTYYSRGYIRGTDFEEVWATRPSGVTEPVSPSEEDGITPREFFGKVTGPDAPTELGEQLQREEELRAELPPWADREVEIDRLLDEHPEQLEGAREDLAQGRVDQAEYDTRVQQLESFKQSLEDERATYAMERGEVEAQQPVLDAYAAELADEGITADALGAHDWQHPTTEPAEPEEHSFEHDDDEIDM